MRPIIIVISHGKMAQATVETAQMIAGECEFLYSVGLFDSGGVTQFLTDFEQVVRLFDTEREFLILADLYGGTPFNVASTYLKNYALMRIVTGFNLGMVLEAILSEGRKINELSEYVSRNALDSIDLLSPEKLIEKLNLQSDDDEIEFD